jgi:putative endonuclease
MRGGWVYIMANRPFGSLYTGVTNDIVRRAWEHRTGACRGFTARYRVAMLAFFERYEDILTAIQREKNIKHWPRRWKSNLIETQNPGWHDLYPTLLGEMRVDPATSDGRDRPGHDGECGSAAVPPTVTAGSVPAVSSGTILADIHPLVSSRTLGSSTV